MIILIIPLLLIALPSTILFLVIKFWNKNRRISTGYKIALGVGFAIIGVIFTLLALIVSIQGHMTGGIKCASGAVVLIPLGLMVNLIGILLILISEKKIRGMEK
jgi:hypothetical protein